MQLDFIIEIFNAVLGFAAIIYAGKVMMLVKGGSLELIWKYIGIAALFFGLLEITGLLAASEIGLNIPNIEFIREILELLSIAMLTFALIKAKKAFTL